MGVGDESGSKASSGMENLSLQGIRFPRDLLQRFKGQSELRVVKQEVDSTEEIELNLGLSLGGRFGVDKSRTKLVRSSSIAGPIPIVRNEDGLPMIAPAPEYTSLVRTSSLPVETEDAWRKRKEMQTLRRMEAKRRRCEKQRVLRSEKDGGGFSESLRGRIGREQYIAAMNKVGSSVTPPPFRLPTWRAGAGAGAIGKGKEIYLGGGGESGNFQTFGQPTSQGSVESQGGSSSSLSELESKPLQGSSSCGEVSPVSGHSLQEQGNTDMPCVFTKGPNGTRIEGILYKYGKGEEVRIMCVCHGKFYSPAEFVEHAGGLDVAHPLKHIVVNPNASSFQ